MNAANRFLVNHKSILIVFLGIALFASIQSYFGGLKSFVEGGRLYTTYNNYIIFKQSFFHLINGQDLYAEFVEEQGDLFKYSPAFALIFSVLAVLPDVLGLSLWNLLNAAVLFFGVCYLPKIDTRTKGLILVFMLVELLTSVQNEQSNALIAGLLLFTFGFLEREKYWLASFCLVSTIFIKLFGIVGLALYLLYPNKLKLTYTTAFWAAFFTLLPLLVVDFNQFIFLYKSWANLLANDHSISDGLSEKLVWLAGQQNVCEPGRCGSILLTTPADQPVQQLCLQGFDTFFCIDMGCHFQPSGRVPDLHYRDRRCGSMVLFSISDNRKLHPAGPCTRLYHLIAHRSFPQIYPE
jgi:hypothetical protein